MEDEDVRLKLNDHDHEIGSLKHRMEGVEKRQDDIASLTNSVNRLAVSVEYMAKEQAEQGKRLDTLEREPADNAKFYKRTILSCIITAVVGAIIGALIALILK